MGGKVVEGQLGNLMGALGRFAWVPLLGLVGAAGLYRGLGAPGEPLPSPMITELPEGMLLHPPRETSQEGAARDGVREGLVRMLEAGLSEEIVAAQGRSAGFRPSSDDLIDLKTHGASEWLLARLIGAPPPAPDLPPAPPSALAAPPPASAPAPVVIETIPPAPLSVVVAPQVEVYAQPEVVVQAPAPEPIAPDVPILGAVLFRPSQHRSGLLPFARSPRVLDPAFKTIPFIPNIPMPAPSVLMRGSVMEGRVRSR